MLDRLLDGCLDAGLFFLGPDCPYRNVIIAIAVLIVVVYVHKRSRHALAAYVSRQALKEENAQRFLRIYDALWKAVTAVVFLFAAAGSFRLLGLTVAILGTMLGWALQVPIRGIAAWVMVVLKRPFRVGDRIAVAGVVGDVVDIQLNHIVLNQVGGTVQGEERSGRGILVPTAMLFDHNIINYNHFRADQAGSAAESGLMLDEVLVRLTFGSDFGFATGLCVAAAQEALQEVLGEPDQPPFTRVELLQWGVLLRVRYRTTPSRRQEVSSRVTELIWEAFRKHPDRVRFCYPASVARVPRERSDAPPAAEPASGH